MTWRLCEHDALPQCIGLLEPARAPPSESLTACRRPSRGEDAVGHMRSRWLQVYPGRDCQYLASIRGHVGERHAARTTGLGVSQTLRGKPARDFADKLIIATLARRLRLWIAGLMYVCVLV
jgi:hypothetical protein